MEEEPEFREPEPFIPGSKHSKHALPLPRDRQCLCLPVSLSIQTFFQAVVQVGRQSVPLISFSITTSCVHCRVCLRGSEVKPGTCVDVLMVSLASTVQAPIRMNL